jgi:hypothetical protein
MTIRVKTLLVGLMGLGLVASLHAQEMRGIRPIPTPEPEPSQAPATTEAPRPVRQETVEQAVAALFAAWNKPELREMLSADFYEQTRLPDALSVKVPRDAVIRVLSISSWQTIAQEVEPADPDGTTIELTSTIAAIVRSQVEYNDPEEGFQRVEGVNEYVFDISEVVPR